MAAVVRKRRGTVGDRPLIQRLITMEAEFKQHHQVVINATEEDEENLHEEQVILDDHDDKASDFMDRLMQVMKNIKAKE